MDERHSRCDVLGLGLPVGLVVGEKVVAESGPVEVESDGGVVGSAFQDEVDERGHEPIDGRGIDTFGVDSRAAHESEVGAVYHGVGVD